MQSVDLNDTATVPGIVPPSVSGMLYFILPIMSLHVTERVLTSMIGVAALAAGAATVAKLPATVTMAATAGSRFVSFTDVSPPLGSPRDVNRQPRTRYRTTRIVATSPCCCTAVLD